MNSGPNLLPIPKQVLFDEMGDLCRQQIVLTKMLDSDEESHPITRPALRRACLKIRDRLEEIHQELLER